MVNLVKHYKKLYSRITELENKISDLEKNYTDLNNKYSDTQRDVMKNNLIVFGINEARRELNPDPNAPKIPSKFHKKRLEKH